MIGKWITRINGWFSEPFGDTGAVPDSPETGLKKSFEKFENSRPKSKRLWGRGDKQEIPRKIEEFYPRGAAGRREVRGPRGAQKAVMPHHGNHPKYPK